MLRLWGRATSTNVKKVVWCALECGISVERVDAGGVFGGLDSPAFLALNPFGQIPVLQDGDFVLRESNTIVRYLASRHPESGFWPTTAQSRALAEQWMDWASIELMPPYRVLFVGLVRTPERERDVAAVADARARLDQLLAPLDRQLGRTPFLSGDRFGVGDIPAGVMLHVLYTLGEVSGDYRHLRTWFVRLCDRPHYRAAVDGPLV